MGKGSLSSVDPSLTDPDWQWTIFDQYEDECEGTQLKKREKVEHEASETGPFEVIFQSTREMGPAADPVTVKLYSRPLISILLQYIPDDGDLKSLDEPTLAGRGLYVVLDSLKKHIISIDKDCQSITADQTARCNSEYLHINQNGASKLWGHTVDAQPSIGSKGPGYTEAKAVSNGECHREASLGEPKLIGEDGEPKELASSQSIGGEASMHEMPLSSGDAVKGEAEAPNVHSDEEIRKRHLRHLLRFLDGEYKDTMVKVPRMRAEKRVPWEMLWAFLPPGTKVIYYSHLTEEMLCGMVSFNYYAQFFTLELDVWDYDGTCYRKCSIQRLIPKYRGEKSFSELPVCPIEIMGIPKQLEEGFSTNGKRFYDLAIRRSNRFMQYTGPMFREGSGGVFKEKADGRVMIDLESFAKMNPQYPMGNAYPPRVHPSSTKITSEPTMGHTGMNDRRLIFSPMENAQPPTQSASKIRTLSKPTIGYADVTDESLIFAPAVVYGFSFALKQWGTFAVSGFREITFDTNAFEELTMAQNMKNLVHNLVSQHVANTGSRELELQRVDPISQKGEGCVFLCYGPPGTGKTLTAESIAEKLERPLWALSVAELGTTPDELEKTLMKVLDIAAIWRAVLLLDEADVYLEKRTSMSDLVRNAMTGVFLRMLEYYRGVLFLTTNRIGTFDDAFRSRISVFLRYPPLSVDDRQKVWRTLLKRGAVEGVTDNLCREFATQDLNGREIRNIVRTAQVWAKSTGEPFGAIHVKYVVELLADSLGALNQDLMNSHVG